MKKIKISNITKSNYFFMTVIMIIASAVIIFLANYSIKVVEKNSARNIIDDRIAMISDVISQNEEENQEIWNNLCNDYKSRARMLALILCDVNSFWENENTLEEIRMALGADEVEVSDKYGNIIYSTAPYPDNNKIAKQFEKGLSDKGFSDTTVISDNGENSILIGISRLDADGIIQVKYSAATINNFFRTYDISSATGSYPLLKDGLTAIIDCSSYTYISHTNPLFVGNNVTIPPENFKNEYGDFIYTISNKQMFVRYRRYNDKIIIGAVPKTEVYYTSKVANIWLFSASILLIIIAVLAVREKNNSLRI